MTHTLVSAAVALSLRFRTFPCLKSEAPKQHRIRNNTKWPAIDACSRTHVLQTTKLWPTGKHGLVTYNQTVANRQAWPCDVQLEWPHGYKFDFDFAFTVVGALD